MPHGTKEAAIAIARAGTLLIVKTGSTFSSLMARRGDFDQWIVAGLGVMTLEVSVVDVAGGEVLPRDAAPAGVVVTGSHAMVTDHFDWSEQTGEWLARITQAGIPLLGICYGHQLLAHALGGQVGDNPRGREFGTAEVQLEAAAARDELFHGLAGRIKVHVGHAQSVLRLPKGAVRLASNAWDANQAFRFGKAAWGVQFHPEFDAEIVRSYIGHYRSKLVAEGQDPERLLRGTIDTGFGATILRRFALIAEKRLVEV